jgi:phage terminase large subunit
MHNAVNVKHVTTGYDPRPLQLYLHQRVTRFAVILCHRRFGKTVWALNEKIDRGMRNMRKNPQYAYIAPTYGQAKRVAWDYLKEYTKNIPGVTVNEAELRVDIPRPHMGDRVRFVLLGAENPNAIRGMYLDGAVLDEYADMYPEIWGQVLRPALSDREGWCIFIGTPKGNNHFYDIYRQASTKMKNGDPEWFAAIFKASQTQVLPEKELKAARDTMSEEEYEQEYECSFSAALIGAYYAKEMAQAARDGRITKVKYDRTVDVHTYWDLGISDSMTIWFAQYVGREIHVIDYIEDSGRDIPYYCKLIKEKPYVYGGHNLPHDGAARELGTGKTRQEQISSLLGRHVFVHPKQKIQDGINEVRTILNRCWFDEEKCGDGLDALRAYQKKWDSKNAVFMDTPLHNWASHGADGFRNMAMAIRAPRSEQQRQLPTRANNKHDVFNRRGMNVGRR